MAGINEAQEKDLRGLYEQFGMEQNYVELISERSQSGLGTARIARCLKTLGLKRGVLTETQVYLHDSSP